MENMPKPSKTSTFRMRIDPTTKQEAELLFANCGITLTDAVNSFLRQSINTGGIPFPIIRGSRYLGNQE